MAEHFICNEKDMGSSPIFSTKVVASVRLVRLNNTFIPISLECVNKIGGSIPLNHTGAIPHGSGASNLDDRINTFFGLVA